MGPARPRLKGNWPCARGALVPADDRDVAQIVRMSCHAGYRRRGIGTALVAELIADARRNGRSRIVLWTNMGWQDANGFYAANGFHETGRDAGVVRYELTLSSGAVRR